MSLIPPEFIPAKILFPSAETTTQFQSATGALFVVQVVPASVEIQIAPPGVAGKADLAAATKVLASAEAARETQRRLGALVTSQLAPALVET